MPAKGFQEGIDASLVGLRPILCAVVLSFAAALSAQTAPRAADVLGPGRASEAAQGMILLSGKDARLLPSHPSASGVGRTIAEEGMPIMVECLSLILRDLPPRSTAAAAEHAELARILSSFSSMEGIRYYSASEKREKILFTVSRRVSLSGGAEGAFLSDPPAPERGGRVDSRVYQEDSRFGGNHYLYSVASLTGALLLEGRNQDPLKLGPLTVVKSGDMRLRLLVIQCSDALVLYAATGVRMPSLFRAKLEESFSNRAKALLSWFASQYGR